MQTRISHKIATLLLLFTTFFTACSSSYRPAREPAPIHVVDPRDKLDINHATVEELERLPSIGPGLAKKIIEHRTRYGPFRRVEHLMLVDGVSDRRFRQIRHLLTAD